jgi:hypothetical protein
MWKMRTRMRRPEPAGEQTTCLSEAVTSGVRRMIDNKRKKGCNLEIEDEKTYILCELKSSILYVINVKTKNS